MKVAMLLTLAFVSATVHSEECVTAVVTFARAYETNSNPPSISSRVSVLNVENHTTIEECNATAEYYVDAWVLRAINDGMFNEGVSFAGACIYSSISCKPIDDGLVDLADYSFHYFDYNERNLKSLKEKRTWLKQNTQ